MLLKSPFITTHRFIFPNFLRNIWFRGFSAFELDALFKGFRYCYLVDVVLRWGGSGEWESKWWLHDKSSPWQKMVYSDRDEYDLKWKFDAFHFAKFA